MPPRFPFRCLSALAPVGACHDSLRERNVGKTSFRVQQGQDSFQRQGRGLLLPGKQLPEIGCDPILHFFLASGVGRQSCRIWQQERLPVVRRPLRGLAGNKKKHPDKWDQP